jgi:disulfide bond formation protein DsbB
MRALSPRPMLAAIAAVAFGAIGAALITQHAFDMQPCPWCILQRLIFIVIGVVALIGLAVWRAPLGRTAVPPLLLLLGGSGIAAALWHYFVAAVSTSCNLTLADRIISALQIDALLPAVFMPTGSCADATTRLFGVPYVLWSLTLFVVIEAALVVLLLREWRGTRAQVH